MLNCSAEATDQPSNCESVIVTSWKHPDSAGYESGFQQSQVLADEGIAETGQSRLHVWLHQNLPHFDDDLIAVVTDWHSLPASVKRSIRVLVDAAGGRNND